MRRLLVLFTLAAGLVSFAALGVVGCGGNDKPPLTPDTLEPAAENVDGGAAGAPATSSTATPSGK